MTDHDEVFDEETDAMIQALGKLIDDYESKTAIICPTKLQQMDLCYAILKRLTKDYSGEVEFEFKPHEPLHSTGYISLKCDVLDFTDTKLFSRAVALADNVEITAMADNRSELSLTFYGLTKPIE